MTTSERQRWPYGAESHRKLTISLAEDTLTLLAKAREEMRRNPLLAEVLIADAMRAQEAIRRVLTEARNGLEPPKKD